MQQPHKTKPSIGLKPTQKILVYLSIDLDTHRVSIGYGPANRKIELNPVGFYVRFVSSYAKAVYLKQRFERFPYLVNRFINH